MPIQDTTNIKEKIISIFKIRGPSLPVHIASRIGLSILFTSAFLAELVSDRKIIISNMRVGSSPIYFIKGQELMLERFSQHLQSKEKEAFILLKERKILDDKKQEPAIRVALRSIRDFAIPFRKDEDIFWRYFTIKEPEIKEIQKSIKSIEKRIIQEKQELKTKEKPKRKKTFHRKKNWL